MVVRGDQKRVAALLTDAIRSLCKSAIAYNAGFCIEGLLGITSFDDDQVFLVSIHETVTRAGAGGSAIGPALYPNVAQQYPPRAPIHVRDNNISKQRLNPSVHTQQLQQATPPSDSAPSQLRDDADGDTETRVPTVEEIQAAAPCDPGQVLAEDGGGYPSLGEGGSGYPQGTQVKDEIISDTDDDMDDSMDGFDSSYDEGGGQPFPQYLSGPMFPGADGGSYPGMWPLNMHANSMMPGQSMQDHPGWMNMVAGGGGPGPDGMMLNPGQLANWAKLRQETVKRRIYRYRLKLTNPEKWQENKRRDAERKRQLRLTMTDEDREKERLRERERKRRQRKVMKEEAAKELEALNLLQGQAGQGQAGLSGVPGVPGVIPPDEAASPQTAQEFQPLHNYQNTNSSGLALPALSQPPNIVVSGTSAQAVGHPLTSTPLSQIPPPLLSQMPPASIMGAMSAHTASFNNSNFSNGNSTPIMAAALGTISNLNKSDSRMQGQTPDQTSLYDSVKQEHS